MHDIRMDSGACLVLYTPLGASNDVTARPGEQKARVRRSKSTMGYSNNICYFPWLFVVLAVSP